MLTVTLFVISPNPKQYRCPSSDEGLKIIMYIYNKIFIVIEWNSLFKRNLTITQDTFVSKNKTNYWHKKQYC